MRAAAAGAALALALLLVPAAAADTGAITFDPGFTTMTFAMELVSTGDDARQMRQAIDQNGNRDGQATQAEADKFASDFKELVGAGVASEVDGDNMTFDGKAPTSTRLTGFALSRAAGATTSGDPLHMHATIALTLHPAAGATHTLFMRGNAEEGDGEVQMTITAPAGFAVQSFTGIPEGSLSADRTVLSFRDYAGNGNDGTVVFGPPPAPAATQPQDGSKASPVLPLPLLLAALLLAGLARRR